MKITTSFLVLLTAFSLSVQLVFADEMNMHEAEPIGEKASDMGMADAEHKAIEMKAHRKYDVSVKKAESEYAAALKKAAKTKNPAVTIAIAKKKLKKAKDVASTLYKKEKNDGMKKATKPAMKPAAKKPAKNAKKPAKQKMK